MKSLRAMCRRDLITVVLSVFFSMISFLFLAIIRSFDANTFLFLQILVVTLLILLMVYGLSLAPVGRFAKSLRGRELAIALVVFMLLSYSVLNIDRSRTFYLNKWISVSGQQGITVEHLAKKYNLSPQDFDDLAQRVGEQKESRTIVEIDGRLHLTLLGKIIVAVSSFIAQLTNLNGYPRA